MTDCTLCNKKLGIIHETENIIAALAPKPASPGHIIVYPKKHYTILEQIPDYEVGELFQIVNKLSIIIFEALQLQGTNIILQNGLAAGQTTPHVMVHIIPRKEKDNINFEWKPKQLTQEEMSTVELKLKQAAETIGEFKKQKKSEPVKLDKKPETIKESEEINYLIKQLERIP